MRSRRGARASLLVGVVAGLLLAVLPATASAAPPPAVVPSTTRVVEGADWASENLRDAFDFANPEDLPPESTSGLLGPVVTDGVLAFGATPGGFVQPIRTLGSILRGRDSEQFPIDTSRYRRISMRIFSASPRPEAGGLFWFTCWGQVPSCGSARSFTLLPGWNTYDFDMTQPPDLMNGTNGWSGQVTGLRIVPAGSTQQAFHAQIDWLRVYEPTNPVRIQVQGGSGTSEVWWDADADPANNDPGQVGGRGAGRLATNVGPNGTVDFNAAAFPPGTYRFYTKQGGVAGAYSSPVTVAPRPQPEVLSPNVAGGDDYATTVRGDAWDFSQPSDIAGHSNFHASFSGGMLHGHGAGLPAAGDPYFYLPTAGPIDATLWHRLSFRITYDGPMGLDDAPGGGMVMRLIWGVDDGAGGISWHDGRDVVVVPGTQTISFDLKTEPPALIEDETAANPIGWGGPASRTIRLLRFDPHEDPGGRSWRIDDVRLARNDRAAPGYTFRYRDNAWQPGTTAELWLDTDRAGFDGQRIDGPVPVTQGVNSRTWNAAGLSPGTYWPYLVMRSSDGTVSRSYAGGSLDVEGPPTIPFGALDAAGGPAGSVQVSGWAIDPDAGEGPIDVHVYSDGRFVGAATANGARPDVAAAVPGYGPAHGYDLRVPIPAGARTICTYGINVGPGGNALLGCRTTQVRSGSPFGSLDSVHQAGPGRLAVSGWALDPDATGPVGVHVYVNGVFSGAVDAATGHRPDVAGVHQGYSPARGYSIPVPVRGATNTVCTYGINVGPGGNALIGCAVVPAPVDAFGSLDWAARSADGRSVTVSGWAIDPDTAQPTEVHVYVGGRGFVLAADRARPDVGQAFPGYGAAHGFSAAVPVPSGPQTLCAYAINRGGTPGGNSLLRCTAV